MKEVAGNSRGVIRKIVLGYENLWTFNLFDRQTHQIESCLISEVSPLCLSEVKRRRQ